MSHTPPKDDELAGTEQPFVQHLVELRDRLLYAIYGVAAAVAVLAMWPGPNGLIDFIVLSGNSSKLWLTTGPTSGTCNSAVSSAAISASRLPKWRAKSLAVASPTWRMPSA